MATIQKLLLGTQASLMTTELNSLANNALAIAGTAFNNTIGGGGGDGYTLADLELLVNFSVAPTANTAFVLWFLMTQDGTNYEDGGSSVQPAKAFDLTFPLRAVTGNQRIIRRRTLPQGNWYPLLMNNGTGQAIASSGNTLKIRPVTFEMV